MKKIFFVNILVISLGLSGIGCKKEIESEYRSSTTRPSTILNQNTSTFHHPIHYLGTMFSTTRRIEALTEKIRENPEKTDLYLDRALAYKDLILQQQASSNLSDYEYIGEWKRQARTDLTTVIASQPTNTQAFFQRSTLFDAKSPVELENDLRDLTRAIELDPTQGRYYFYRGLTFLELKHFEQAIADLTQALTLPQSITENSDTHYYRAKAYVSQGKNNEALKDYDAMLKMTPENRSVQEERNSAAQNMLKTILNK